jgi:hypothetical protein
MCGDLTPCNKNMSISCMSNPVSQFQVKSELLNEIRMSQFCVCQALPLYVKIILEMISFDLRK